MLLLFFYIISMLDMENKREKYLCWTGIYSQTKPKSLEGVLVVQQVV
jgi:hypothetical protein